jgi:hypothetical protein
LPALKDVSRQTLYDTLGERQPVTPVRRYGLVGSAANGPHLWLNLQKT